MMAVERADELFARHGVGLLVWDLPSPLKKKMFIDE